MLILGVNQHSTWKGSTKTLEGLPLTMLILGGQSTLHLERIHKDFGRIASDNVDPGGVNQHSTWKGSTNTLEGSPLTMLILGGFNQQSPWKECVETLSTFQLHHQSTLPLQINIVQCNPSKVFRNPFQLQGPQDQHCQR